MARTYEVASESKLACTSLKYSRAPKEPSKLAPLQFRDVHVQGEVWLVHVYFV